MSFAEVHLAGAAVAGLVDGELSALARHRALAHLAGCGECAQAVSEQRQIALLLQQSADLPMSGGLLEKLCGIPMDTDLGQSDRVLAFSEGELMWGSADSKLGQQGFNQQADRVLTPQLGVARLGRSTFRIRPSRRALLGGLVGLLVGVVATTTSQITAASTTGHRPSPTPSRTSSPITVQFGQPSGDTSGSVTEGQVVSNSVGSSSAIRNERHR